MSHGTVKDQPLPPLPARNIGAYQLAAQLGQGPHGGVFLARRAGLERLFALKLFSGSLNKEALESCRQGVQTGANLKHPGLVRPVDIGVFQNRLYVVTDHIPGLSIAERLREGALPWREATRLIDEVTESIDVAHRAGVIHQDLKPTNVIVDGRDHRAKVTDLGLPRRETDTPCVAPEQRRGEPVGPPADVYALGALLFMLLVGQPPPPRPSDTPISHDLEGKVPEKLQALIRDCLAEDAAARPATAGALLQRLRDIQGRPSRPGSGFTGTFSSLVGIRPGVLVPLMAVWVIALACVTGWAVWEHSERQETNRRLEDARTTRSEVETRLELEREELSKLRDTHEAVRSERSDLRASQVSLRSQRDRLERDVGRLRSENERLVKEAQKRRTPTPAPAAQAVNGDISPAAIMDWLVQELEGIKGTELLRAQLLHNRGDFEKTLEVIAAAKRGGNTHPRLLILEGRTHAKSGNQQRGTQLFAEAARKAPDSPDGMFGKATSGASSGVEAIRLLQEVRRKAPRLSYPRVLLANILLQDPRGLREAVQVADEAVKLDPTSYQAYWVRSLARYTLWVRSGRRDTTLPDSVIGDLKRAQTLHGDPKYWLYAGKSYLEMYTPPRTQQARAELKIAVRKADEVGDLSTRVASRFYLGGACAELKEVDMAAKIWLEALKLTPDRSVTQGLVPYLRRYSQVRERLMRDAPPEIRSRLQRMLGG